MLAGVVLYFLVRSLRGQWADISQHRLDLHPYWPAVLGSALVTLAAYAILIETWRRIIRGLAGGATLGFGEATRIWFASNLAKYVPGAVVQIGAMAYMARAENVSGVAAGAAAILNVIVNVATGIVAALALGSAAMHTLPPLERGIGIALAAAGLVGLGVLPWIAPPLLRLAGRATRRPVASEAVAPHVVLEAIIGNALAWVAYGVALQLVVPGVLGFASGRTIDYVAAYAASYVVGYLALISPGGVGFREGAMATLLPVLVPRITVAQALMVAVSSRAIMTVLELVPGFVYLARSSSRRRGANSLSSDGPT